MKNIFADRMNNIPRSFIREILKVTLKPGIISFAGGLPNSDLFPLEQLQTATEKLFTCGGSTVFQYATTEGYVKLREYISARYRSRNNLYVPVENILITSGSQQGLDLLGKIMISSGDGLVIEEPGYLGAIQAFSIYSPRFLSVPVSDEGMDREALQHSLDSHETRLIYTVPNFQNPSGITYSTENRIQLAATIEKTTTFLIEDDPYGELRFSGEPKPSFLSLIPENTILLGSFSKTIVPGFRLGWIVAPPPVMEKLITAKQATDLHTSHFTQAIIHQFLIDNDVDTHIEKIVQTYGSQKIAMEESIREFFPPKVTVTDPEGGMFLWVTLPGDMKAMELFHTAIKNGVAFVPGDPFYIDRKDSNCLRLSFVSTNEEMIRTGIKRLGATITQCM
ncbi:aminotransferase-like domain-containing protein [Desulfomarina profundi]|nr:PLP-dependent aminotransferase family protein [Desulfomarina profundi]